MSLFLFKNSEDNEWFISTVGDRAVDLFDLISPNSHPDKDKTKLKCLKGITKNPETKIFKFTTVFTWEENIAFNTFIACSKNVLKSYLLVCRDIDWNITSTSLFWNWKFLIPSIIFWYILVIKQWDLPARASITCF